MQLLSVEGKSFGAAVELVVVVKVLSAVRLRFFFFPFFNGIMGEEKVIGYQSKED